MSGQNGEVTKDMNAAEVAEMLGVSRWVVYDLCQRRILPHYRRSPRRLGFDRAQLEAFKRRGGASAWRPYD